MSVTGEQLVTIAAVVLLLTTVPVLWQIGQVRTMQAAEEQSDELLDQVATNRQAADDYDGDGIRDSKDRCPTRPETENGFQDADGCPDVVGTTGAS